MFQRYGYARHAGYHGGWGGHHRHHRGPGPLLPFLAGALLMRAAMKGSRRHDRGGKRGPWRRWEDGPHFGRRGDWWGSDEQRQMREAFFALRSEVGPTMALLRDAFRQGNLDSAKLNEIRAVLSEARRRITTIVSGTGPVEV